MERKLMMSNRRKHFFAIISAIYNCIATSTNKPVPTFQDTRLDRMQLLIILALLVLGGCGMPSQPASRVPTTFPLIGTAETLAPPTIAPTSVRAVGSDTPLSAATPS